MSKRVMVVLSLKRSKREIKNDDPRHEYKEGEDYREIDGMWYWIDEEHQGHILINEVVVKNIIFLIAQA